MEWLTPIVDFLGVAGAWIIGALAVTLPVLATVHVLMTRDEPRAAMAWFGFVWFVPVLGVAFYMLFGMKRIERRARLERLRVGMEPRPGLLNTTQGISLKDLIPRVGGNWQRHSHLSERISRFNLASGNSTTILGTGLETYDRMVEEIEKATSSIALSTYIFQADTAGRKIVKALIRAKNRGVAVKVLVDAVGNWYGFKPVAGILRKNDVDVAYFNPARLSWRMAFFNLRTHRKLLIIDGRTGFMGGMNIRKNHIPDAFGVDHMRDTHFMLTGPAVDQLMYSFADDWAFSTGELLSGAPWFNDRTELGAVVEDTGQIMRAIADGPDEDENKTELIWASAISSAEKSIFVQTPYFVPGETLISALRQAAMRGVAVTVLIPARSNLRFVDFASWVLYPDLLEAGVKVMHGNEPFDHSKLLVVDGFWSVIGSSNWDARSLLLNFEFNMEIYDKDFAGELTDRIKANSAGAKTLTIGDIQGRSIMQKLLDKFVWLASPYL